MSLNFKIWKKFRIYKNVRIKKNFKHITDPGFNFKNYRLIWSHQKSKAPCGIPFISLLVKDACFQAEDSRKTLTNIDASGENLKPVIDSFLKVSEPLQYLLKRSQNLPEKVLDEDLSRLIQSPTLNEDLLYIGSFKTETPNTAYEKNAYKQLKQKLK